MKAIQVIAPSVAIGVVAVCCGYQWRAIAAQEAQARELRERIAQAQATRPASVEVWHNRKGPTPGDPASDDWQQVANRLNARGEQGGMANMSELMRLRKRLDGMSAQELLAEMEKINALGLSPAAKAQLEEMLIEPLMEKDPELALKTFTDRIPNEDDPIGWQLSSALAAWAKQSPAEATAWLDAQIAAGLFESKSLDGQSQPRLDFEAALVSELLAIDPQAAAQRIAALPEDQRRLALEQVQFAELQPSAQAAYAEVVRGLVPTDERAGSFTHLMAELIPDGGYAKVDAFLDSIHATPEERAVSAREAANCQLEEIAGERSVTREDVEAMRTWLERQAPGSADRVTGEALADAAQSDGEFTFDQASQLALEYHRRSPNDDVLVAFLESFAARSNVEEALPLAQQIRDPQRRNAIIQKLK